jgi:hypothetical protein
MTIDKFNERDGMNEEGDVVSLDEQDFPEYEPLKNEDGELINDHVVYALGGIASAFERPEVVTPALPRSERLSEAARAERVVMVKEQEKFYVQSNREMDHVMGMANTPRTKSRTVDYLDSVYAHQKDKKTKTDDPKSALRSIIDEFKSYAIVAYKDASFVRGFLNNLRLDGINNLSGFSVGVPFEDWKDDEFTKRALTVLSRYKEINSFTLGLGPDLLGKGKVIDDIKGQERDQRIKEALNPMRVGAIEPFSEAVILDEKQRYDYWVSRLKEARAYPYVSGQAYDALRDIDKLRSPEK